MVQAVDHVDRPSAAAAVYAFALDLSFEQSSWSLFWYSSVSAGVGSGLAVGLSGEVYYGTTQVAAVQGGGYSIR